MEYKNLVNAGIKKHKGTLIGIFILILLVSSSLGTVLTVWTNSDSYLHSETKRAEFGDLTAWVSKVSDIDELAEQMEKLSDIERVEAQHLVFSSYTVGTQESDSEGQLIPYKQNDNRYRFFTDKLLSYQNKTPVIGQGEVYVSPSLISMFGIKIGDEISFAVTRNSGTVTLAVKGYYEDPFMGSSMIGMKGFLIAENDYLSIVNTIQEAGINALARDGSMLHIFKAKDSQITTAELNSKINEATTLPQYTEFVHSADAIIGFMLILQKAFSGLLIAFVLVLLIVVLIVLGHSITSAIETDYVNMGILKTIGITTKTLRCVQLIQYMIFILPAMAVGLALSGPISAAVNSATVTTSGIRCPSGIPWSLCILVFISILLILIMFIVVKTAKIRDVKPMRAIRGETESNYLKFCTSHAINGKHVGISLAVRQLLTDKKKYAGACVI